MACVRVISCLQGSTRVYQSLFHSVARLRCDTLRGHFRLTAKGVELLKLDDVVADVAAQLDDQAGLGVSIVNEKDIPEVGPANGGIWARVPKATAVFADLKRSTLLSLSGSRTDAAYAYTYFIRAMTVILDRFSARYVDIQGDAVFGLFSGKGSIFSAAACAVTMKTQMEQVVEPRFLGDASSKQSLKVGIGVDQGTLLVRRLGLRSTGRNEVWAGRAVNVAAKLSSLAGDNQLVVSDRVFADYSKSSNVRQRALLWSCGCDGGILGGGLALPPGATTPLWGEVAVPGEFGLDFNTSYRLYSKWCVTHGPEFCETLITGAIPKG